MTDWLRWQTLSDWFPVHADHRRMCAARRAYRGSVYHILFSEKKNWEPTIRAGLAGWPVDVSFASLQTMDLEQFDLVVPLEIEDSRWLALQTDYNRCNAIPVADLAVIDLCDDKLRFDAALVDMGFGEHVPHMNFTRGHLVSEMTLCYDYGIDLPIKFRNKTRYASSNSIRVSAAVCADASRYFSPILIVIINSSDSGKPRLPPWSSGNDATAPVHGSPRS